MLGVGSLCRVDCGVSTSPASWGPPSVARSPGDHLRFYHLGRRCGYLTSGMGSCVFTMMVLLRCMTTLLLSWWGCWRCGRDEIHVCPS